MPDHVIAGSVDLGPADEAIDGPGRPVAIDDRTVLAILDALLTIEVKAGRARVAQRVSYKALDVEQIGHCYEGLLDHGASRIDGLSLGLIGPDGGEPEIWIDDLESRFALGQDVLCEWLSDKERCSRTATALAGLLGKQPDGVDLARLRIACGHDDETAAKVLPFWGLIRTDLRGLPIVLLPGSQYVTQTSTRRNMGAQYTTKALAEEVVQYALEPLVYEPGPQNEPDPEKWTLRTPAQILDLRVCDPAVGSGAILTAAGRYLADRLIEAVAQYGPGEGKFAERLADLSAAPADEQVTLARREIVDHCLYGVDKNPVAAEMAKLSLWLTTMARERPFTFLDHAIQVGDTLLGITDLDQLRWLHLEPSQRKGVGGFETLALDERIEEATDLARRLQELSVVTVRDAAEKQRLHDELRAKLADLAIVADTVVGAALSTAGKREAAMEDRLGTQLLRVRTALDGASSTLERSAALSALQGTSTGWLRTDLPDEVPAPWERQCLHWPIAFPEVFLSAGRQGFDGIVANPPFLGGQRITGAIGIAVREHLVTSIAAGAKGSADLAAYFLLRMCALAPSVGTLATNTISQGDTREVGLDALLAGDWAIHRAVKSEPWPNDANLEIAKLWAYRGEWACGPTLNGLSSAAAITSSLERATRVTGAPLGLAANSGQAFIGSSVLGMGFVISPETAADLIKRDSRNAEVVRPYLGGKDLNDHPTQLTSRWVINFFDWPVERAREYPDCFEIVERLVRPERARVNRVARRERWWRYAEPAPNLYAAIAELDQVIAIVLHSPNALPLVVPSRQVFSHALAVVTKDDFGWFGLLSSAFHSWWAVQQSGTLGGESTIRYNTTRAFETFPSPRQSSPEWAQLHRAGQVLNETRSLLMERTRLGLTKTYNRFHDPSEGHPEVIRLRELHVQLDMAVRRAYGWSDLPLDHHHWETPQGMRFTVSPAAKDELLDRLLELNHQRYAEEVAAGLHEKKSKKSPPKRAKAADANQESML